MPVTQKTLASISTGLTLTAKAYAAGVPATIVQAASAVSEISDGTDLTGIYEATFTDLPAADYTVMFFVGGTKVADYDYRITLDTATFLPVDLALLSAIGNVPSAEEISDRLERSGGPLDTALDSIAPLTGPFSLTPTVIDSETEQPIEGALVRVYRTGASQSKRTLANGSTSVYALENFIWSIAASALGYASRVTSQNVSDDTTLTIELDPIAIAEPDAAGMCRLIAYVFKGTTPIQGATVSAKLARNNQATDGVIQSIIATEATTDANGLATIDLVQGGEFVDGDGVYEIVAKHENKTIWSITSAMPDQSQVNLEDLLTPP